MNNQRYKINKMIGSGTTATVWLAEDTHLGNRDVAIKKANFDTPEARMRFEREFKVINSLQHPSILSVFDGDWSNDKPYIVMPYLSGGTLLERTDIGDKKLFEIMGTIASGLAYAHSKGIVHRDVKPNNIMFNEFDEPFLMDWGIGKAKDSVQITTIGNMIGTAQFFSPEILEGSEPIPEADVWAWGVTSFYSLTGSLPFKGKTISEIYNSQRTPEVHLPEWLRTWEETLAWVFQTDPEQRPSAKEIAQWCFS